MPALIEGHNHFIAHALQRSMLDLSQTRTASEGFEQIRHFHRSLPPGVWLRGGGWSVARWGKDFLHKKYLDQLVPDRPVALESTDFHSIWINSTAQRLLEIPDVPPAEMSDQYGRDDDGNFNGILYENARMIVYEKVPLREGEFFQKAIKDTIRYYHSHGFVHAVTMDGEKEITALLSNLPPIPNFSFSWYFPAAMLDQYSAREIGHRFAREDFSPVGIKIFMDGAFGSRTAWLNEPYDGTNHRGLQTIDTDLARRLIRIAHDQQLGVAVHAIGDAAITETVRLFEEQYKRKPGAMNYPNRLEHVQLPLPEDLRKIGLYQLGVSIQPCHIPEDIPIIQRYLNSRAHRCYPFREMELYHIPLIMSSDAPVKEIDPWYNIYLAMTQHDPQYDRFLNPKEILSLSTALKGYTSTSALYTARPSLGNIRVGADANVVLLNTDLSTVLSPADLLEVKIAMTMVAGEPVYLDEKEMDL